MQWGREAVVFVSSDRMTSVRGPCSMALHLERWRRRCGERLTGCLGEAALTGRIVLVYARRERPTPRIRHCALGHELADGRVAAGSGEAGGGWSHGTERRAILQSRNTDVAGYAAQGIGDVPEDSPYSRRRKCQGPATAGRKIGLVEVGAGPAGPDER
jgi:hypothetical protein